MRVYLTLCSAALVVVTSIVFAGTTGKIAGTVRDAQSGEPLPSVNIVLEGTMIGAATNAEGYFVILNIPPGRYRIVATLVGYKTASALNVRVDIDQTTDLNLRLTEETIAGEEVTIIASRPVVQKDVAASRANIEIEDIEKLPVTSVASVVTLQAGIQGGLVIRGSSSDQAAFVVDGMLLRDERTNQPFTGISISSIQDVQVQTGGFNAEYGNLRSGWSTSSHVRGDLRLQLQLHRPL
jgi:outer membrane receptor protein involved in Fe transport